MNSIDLKIVVLGPAGVGKTCVINRYCNNTFLESTLSTIGAGFFPQSITIDNIEVNMMIWDTAGEERFRAVAPNLLRGANGLILIFDITNPESFSDLDIYLNMFLETAEYDQNRPLPVMLLGNKGDMEKVVEDQIIDDWMHKNNINKYFIVSAKTGDGVKEAFTEFVKTFVSSPVEPEKRAHTFQITPNDAATKKKVAAKISPIFVSYNFYISKKKKNIYLFTHF